jgi:hypothetical protein
VVRFPPPAPFLTVDYPRCLQGEALYRETEGAFSQGDRVQFAAPNPEKYIANRELGTFQTIDGSGIPSVRRAVVEPASECGSRTHKRSLVGTKEQK